MNRLVSYIAYHLRIWKLLSVVSRLIKGKNLLVVLTYHRITGEAASKYYLRYDRGLDAEVFKKQIETVGEYFDILTLDNFIEMVTGRKKPEKHSALLTFDDADSEFMEHAYPVLSRNNFPATVFAPTGFIDTEERFWHLRVSNLFLNMNSSIWDKIRADAENLPDRLKSIVANNAVDDDRDRSNICREVVNILDRLDHDEVIDIIERWEDISGVKYTLGIRCLGWKDLKLLAGNGYNIESHTVSHRKLAFLTAEQVKDELRNSRTALEKELDVTVKAICYPAGSYDEKVAQLAAESGYEVGFTTVNGISHYPLGGLDLYMLPRTGVYGEDKYTIHMSIGKLILKSIVGKNDAPGNISTGRGK